MLIIEDVQDWSHMEALKQAIPDNIQYTLELHDLRKNKDRADDMMFILHKK